MPSAFEILAARLVSRTANEILAGEFPVTEFPAGDFPALRGLGLGDLELAALSRQGFVSPEQRGPHRAVTHKLRYRIQGRQRTRYLGSDPGFLEQIRRELTELQRPVRRARNLQKAVREAWRGLRQAKSTLAPLLEAEGWSYHGLTIRRRRTPAPGNKDNVKREVLVK